LGNSRFHDNLMTTLVNKHYNKPYDIYIGRGSMYGNPYIIGIDGSREEVIEKYKKYFYDRIEYDEDFKKGVLNLRDKRLACFCYPKQCHGDVIIEYLDGPFQEPDKCITCVDPLLVQEFFSKLEDDDSSL